MLLGLAVACYSRGSYDQAERFFFEAADLNPTDPTPYMFLGQARTSPIGQSGGFVERIARFVRLQPGNAWAHYYYAMCFSRSEDSAKAQSLLEKAVRLDPRLGAAWLELGILFADQNNFPKAISAWQSAIASGLPTGSAPEMAMIVVKAHYRLAQAYRRTGEQAKARSEIELYEQLSKQSVQEEERERTAIREFVFKLRDQSPGHQ
jgi:tetratricopeptide (TPR) repeat protein